MVMETVQIDAYMRIVQSVRRCLRAATKGFGVYQRKDSVSPKPFSLAEKKCVRDVHPNGPTDNLEVVGKCVRNGRTAE